MTLCNDYLGVNINSINSLYRTEQKGTTTLAAGLTTKTFAHGLTSTPGLEEFA